MPRHTVTSPLKEEGKDGGHKGRTCKAVLERGTCRVTKIGLCVLPAYVTRRDIPFNAKGTFYFCQRMGL